MRAVIYARYSTDLSRVLRVLMTKFVSVANALSMTGMNW
jgi:hypothetical protein